MQIPDDRYEPISVDEAASRLKVSPSTVRRMIRDGKIAAEREQRPQGEIVRVLWPAAVADVREVAPPVTAPSEPVQPSPAIDLPAALSAATSPLVEVLALERAERQKLAQDVLALTARTAAAEARAALLAEQLERERWRWWHRFLPPT
jgi:excisionase family DNA binding protein